MSLPWAESFQSTTEVPWLAPSSLVLWPIAWVVSRLSSSDACGPCSVPFSKHLPTISPGCAAHVSFLALVSELLTVSFQSGPLKLVVIPLVVLSWP